MNGQPGVLAVMDAVANGIHAPNEGEIQIAHHTLHDFLEARATVERLAEKAQALVTEMEGVECFPCVGSDNPFEDALGQLVAELASFRGEA